LQGRPGHVYALEYKNQLTNPTWVSLPLKAGAPWPIQLADPSAPSAQRFYRVREW
jgi:hypothetical protein